MKYILPLSLLSFAALLVTAGSYESQKSAPQVRGSAPQGDIRMGADAVDSGTDITDQDIQAQETSPDDEDHWPREENKSLSGEKDNKNDLLQR